MRYIADYDGRRIRLTDERIGHILGHPEMVGMGPVVEETLARPQLVIRSRSDPDVHLYYAFRKGTRVGDLHVCVVVKIQVDPLVITAYLTDQPKKGELVWSAER